MATETNNPAKENPMSFDVHPAILKTMSESRDRYSAPRRSSILDHPRERKPVGATYEERLAIRAAELVRAGADPVDAMKAALAGVA